MVEVLMADTTNHTVRRDCRKLVIDEALSIRSRYAAGIRARDLAVAHGVSLASVYAVLREKSHRCVLRTEFPPTVFALLTEAALGAGCTREQLAADLVARALAPSPSR